MVIPEHHDALVDRLVQETHPVRRLWSVRVRLTVFVLLAGAVIATGAARWSRPDFEAKLTQLPFTLGIVTLLIATIFTAMLALRGAVPGRSPSRTEGIVTVVVVVLAALFSCTQPLDTDTALRTFLRSGWACAARTFGFGILPWTCLMVAIRRGAPTRVTTAGAYAGASALLLSTTLLRTACPDDGPLHWVVWHFTPIAIGTMLSAAVASTWLTWRHSRPPAAARPIDTASAS
jgi:hypothetical protein